MPGSKRANVWDQVVDKILGPVTSEDEANFEADKRPAKKTRNEAVPPAGAPRKRGKGKKNSKPDV